MQRAAARALAKTTLDATSAYTLVAQGALASFDGKTPVAIVTSRTMRLEMVTRAIGTIANGLYISIYVRKDEGAAGAEAAEDQLDTLVRQAVIALEGLNDGDTFEVGETDAAPDGFPLRLIDGVPYRVERIPVTVLEEGSV